MSLDSEVDLLSRVPVFVDLDADQLRLIAFGAGRIDLTTGQTLFQRGDPAASGFLVTSGSITLLADRDGSTHTCVTGDLIGELPLFVETRRKVTATAAEPSSVREISRVLVRRMLGEYPEIAARLHQRMSGRLMGTIAELKQVRETLLAAGGPG